MRRCLNFSIILAYSMLVFDSVTHLSDLVHTSAYLMLALSHIGMVLINLNKRKVS
jgi:hypothetical protein